MSAPSSLISYMNKRITLKYDFFPAFSVSIILTFHSNFEHDILVNLRRVVVVGATELARGLLGRHPLLDALPLLGVQLFLIDPLHLKLRLQFLQL